MILHQKLITFHSKSCFFHAIVFSLFLFTLNSDRVLEGCCAAEGLGKLIGDDLDELLFRILNGAADVSQITVCIPNGAAEAELDLELERQRGNIRSEIIKYLFK